MNTQPSILVIDDEPDNFDVIETLLHNDIYQFHYAPSGRYALERLDYFQPDVILLDVMMPDLDGIEVCRQIKALPQWQVVPIIMVTALSSKEDLAKCLSAGANDFISKPVSRVELSARVQSMLRIKKQYDDLQVLLQQREDMVNMVVHDMRTPLTNIFLLSGILKAHSALTKQQQQRVEQIALAGQQLQFMIDNLLLMAKVESGTMMLNYSDADLCALCSSAIADMEAIAAEKRLTLVSYLPDPGGMVTVDINIFRRVLDNLLANAVKFSPENNQISVQATYLQKGGAQIQIADSGPGVPEELQHSIFEKYEVGTLFKDVPQIGLGLAFCKVAIEAHGGSISVQNNQPQGAIFTISLAK
jgi:two-component system, sensor histidine kinase and response regulator